MARAARASTATLPIFTACSRKENMAFLLSRNSIADDSWCGRMSRCPEAAFPSDTVATTPGYKMFLMSFRNRLDFTHAVRFAYCPVRNLARSSGSLWRQVRKLALSLTDAPAVWFECRRGRPVPARKDEDGTAARNGETGLEVTGSSRNSYRLDSRTRMYVGYP